MSDLISKNYTYTTKVNGAKNGEFWWDDGKSSEISMNDFLQLMIAQLANQDFNNAVDNTEFINQMAQFTSIQAINEMNSLTRMNYASTLVGREVAVSELIGGQQQIKYGKVEAMSVVNNEPVLYIDNQEYSLDQISQVYPNEYTEDSLTNITSISMMSLAASLLGAKVDVVKTDEDGNNEIISGTVESMARVEGESKVFVNGEAYSLGSVVKVYPKSNEKEE